MKSPLREWSARMPATKFAEPEFLAKIIDRQAKRPKEQVPTEFTQAVKGWPMTSAKALGVIFEREERDRGIPLTVQEVRALAEYGAAARRNAGPPPDPGQFV
jgi:hypothetical protein